MPNQTNLTGAGKLPSWPLFSWVPLFWCGVADVRRNEAAATSFTPTTVAGTWIKGMAQASCELTTLAARRTQAWQSASIELCRARTPSEVAAVHARFWQDAVSDQQQALRGIMTAWSSVVPAPRAVAAPVVRDRLDLDAGPRGADPAPAGRPADHPQRSAA